MKNVFFLVLAIVLFGLAYWLITHDPGRTPTATRGMVPPSEFALLLQQWQPYLTAASSLGGILSFVFQLRIWMRGNK